ncbi:MAG: hypothetical protein IPK79_08530 [Vampirovibrionales bacterium]|nr:hypothetical protein [Vampirovibrionales bacterium]
MSVSQPRVAFGGETLLARAGQRVANPLLRVFNQIDASYLVGFVAMDVVGLWIERIFTGLVAGRYRYDAKADPQNRDLSPWRIHLKSARKNLQGLNWTNMWEELKREALTAPGCLGLPSLAFAWARWKRRTQANELGYTSLKTLTHSFSEKLGALKGPLTPQAFQSHLKTALSELFPDAAMRATALDTGCEPLARAYGLIAGIDNTSAAHTYGDFIDQWAERFSQRASEGLSSPEPLSRQDFKRVSQALVTLNDDLKTALLEHYNRLHGDDVHALNRGDVVTRLWENPASAQGPAIETLQRRPLAKLLNDLTLYKDALQEAFRVHQTQPQGVFAQALRATERRILRSKFAFAMIGTGLGSAWLLMLPHFVQKSARYPATRLYLQRTPQKADAPTPSPTSSVASMSQSPSPLSPAASVLPQAANKTASQIWPPRSALWPQTASWIPPALPLPPGRVAPWQPVASMPGYAPPAWPQTITNPGWGGRSA